MAFVITRSLTRQLGGEPAYVAEIASKVSQGDLTLEIQTRAADTGSVLLAMKNMVEKLSSVVTEVNGGAERGLPISCFLNAVNDDLGGIDLGLGEDSWQSGAEDRRLDLVEPAVHARLEVLVARDLPTVAQPPDPGVERRVVGDDGAPVTQRAEILRGIEAEGATKTGGADRSARCRGQMCLAAILHKGQAMT